MSQLISASAGSGKTHALTSEYLRLLLAGQSPESLLAATFTRKAAGEILDRALSRLASACLEDQVCAELGAAVLDDALSLSQCRALLLDLCGGLDRLAVGTLDGFFAQLCALVEPGTALTDTQSPRCRALRSDALRAMLAQIPAEEMEVLLDALHEEKTSPSVLETLDKFASNIAETLADAPPDAWNALTVPPPPPPDVVADALHFLRNCRDTLTDKVWQKAVSTGVQQFESGDWEGFVGKGIAPKCLAGEQKFSSKPISPEMADAYEALIGVARAELLAELQRGTWAIRDIVTLFSREYRRGRDAEGLLLFSEAPGALLPWVSDQDALARRLTRPLDHLLLDEFQDTSERQWAVLRPFVLRATGADGSVFVVGDVKQAIYGWRGGRAEIFERIADDLPAIERLSRSVSFRSSAVVLNAVNRVFGSLADHPALAELDAARDRWRMHFQPHAAHRERRGCVEMRETPPGGDHGAYCAEAIAQEIRSLPLSASVAVLVRRNETGTQYADALRALGMDVSSEGKGAIADDPAVEVLLSALTFADHPGDTAAAFHVARSPLAARLGLSPDLHQSPGAAALASRALRRALLTRGWADTLADWAAHLAPFGTARTARRLEQLLEFAAQMDALPPMRASEFVQAARDHAAENPGTARVRVMTINHAKGLEFDAVFLPELDWSAGGRPPLFLTRRAGLAAEHPVAAIYRYPRKPLPSLAPELAAAVAERQEEEATTLLCLLYVALTRARHALHLYVAPSPKSALTPANILRHALAGEPQPLPDGGTVLMHMGESDWGQPIDV